MNLEEVMKRIETVRGVTKLSEQNRIMRRFLDLVDHPEIPAWLIGKMKEIVWEK